MDAVVSLFHPYPSEGLSAFLNRLKSRVRSTACTPRGSLTCVKSSLNRTFAPRNHEIAYYQYDNLRRTIVSVPGNTYGESVFRSIDGQIKKIRMQFVYHIFYVFRSFYTVCTSMYQCTIEYRCIYDNLVVKRTLDQL